jgi:hypothetical protein
MEEDVEIQFTEDKKTGEIVKLWCAQCASKNKHTIIHSSREYAQVDGMWFDTSYCIVRCNGCERQSFCTVGTSSEDMDGRFNKQTQEYETYFEEKTSQYPTINVRYKEIDHYFSTPLELRQICNETYAALCEKSAKLASVGMRVIIETTCALHGITNKDARTLPSKIKLLSKRQVISQGIEGILLSVKDFGDIGAHTLRTPTADELETAWNAIKIMVSSIYGTEDAKTRIVSMKGFSKDGTVPQPDPF